VPSSASPQAPNTPQCPGQSSGASMSSSVQTAISPSLKSYLAGSAIWVFSYYYLLPINAPLQGHPSLFNHCANNGMTSSLILLSDDESNPVAATSRYALICEKCFNHNGLVPGKIPVRIHLRPLFSSPTCLFVLFPLYSHNSFSTTEYVCPKCDHFNASA
jgi:hypothetical protein